MASRKVRGGPTQRAHPPTPFAVGGLVSPAAVQVADSNVLKFGGGQHGGLAGFGFCRSTMVILIAELPTPPVAAAGGIIWKVNARVRHLPLMKLPGTQSVVGVGGGTLPHGGSRSAHRVFGVQRCCSPRHSPSSTLSRQVPSVPSQQAPRGTSG